MSARSVAKLRLAAQILGVSQREYTRGRAAGTYPGLRQLESFGVFEDAELRANGLEPLPPKASRSRGAQRDFRGQNQRANDRARALGYRSKDDLAARRRAGNPTPADVKAGGATWQRQPGGRLWLRVPFDDGAAQERAERTLDKLLATMPAGTFVSVTVGFTDGTFRQITSGNGVPIYELAPGLALFLADLLADYNGRSGTGGEKKADTPDMMRRLARIEAGLINGQPAPDDEPDDTDPFDFLEEVAEVQLTFHPPTGRPQDDDF